jgi:hypothetical protein
MRVLIALKLILAVAVIVAIVEFFAWIEAVMVVEFFAWIEAVMVVEFVMVFLSAFLFFVLFDDNHDDHFVFVLVFVFVQNPKPWFFLMAKHKILSL